MNQGVITPGVEPRREVNSSEGDCTAVEGLDRSVVGAVLLAERLDPLRMERDPVLEHDPRHALGIGRSGERTVVRVVSGRVRKK